MVNLILKWASAGFDTLIYSGGVISSVMKNYEYRKISIIFTVSCLVCTISCNFKQANQPICMSILKDTAFVIKSDNWSGGVSNIYVSMNTRVDSSLKIVMSYPKEIRLSKPVAFTLNYSKGNTKIDTCLEYYATSLSVQIFVKNKPSNPLPICFKFNDFRLPKWGI